MAWFARRLSVLAILVGFLCLPLQATSAQQSAPVTDCSHAKTAVDRAICTTPELRAADARMAHAYLVWRARSTRCCWLTSGAGYGSATGAVPTRAEGADCRYAARTGT